MTENTRYEERLGRVTAALALKEPDRVPCAPFAQTYPYLHAGYTMADVLYDVEKAKDGIRKYVTEYEPDLADGYGVVFGGQGPIMEKLGVTWLQWAGEPGSSIPENSIHQYIEKPYLGEDEYFEILSDLTGWITRKWFPRGFTALEPFANFDVRSTLGYGAFPAMMQFADGKILESVQTMTEVGRMLAPIYADNAAFEAELIGMGFPVQTGATTTVAYDQLSDTLRGTIGVMTDVLEQPEMVHAALEMFYPGGLFGTLAQMQYSKGQFVFIPLHKGMDGFLSPDQYDEFYWPTLIRLVEALIEKGLKPFLYTEGNYDSRLERLADLPDGKVLVHFEHADMAAAKRIVGPHACISGGFNTRLLETGTKEQVVDEIKRLLDICAPGGGYIFDVNDTLDNCKPENVEAMFATVKEYGKY